MEESFDQLMKAKFVKALLDTTHAFNLRRLEHVRVIEKGWAIVAEYRSAETKVELLFGPADWMIEMLVETKSTRYGIESLFEISMLRKWIGENPLPVKDERNIRQELEWNLKLYDTALPLLE
ncbi:hypothetical protein [Pseudochryseolinea flava]|uniref:Uncharacterized protein n=1 Tax=Pseudochryseolinea flava TaxID=2059302 RepID=A0A364Y1X9_9BACT|nr:hypothetical protein [Pseudochryseolinea flava]RAW00667.1 hypothetical protein DQQ10_13845 [Pseudochryseolinea flava]